MAFPTPQSLDGVLPSATHANLEEEPPLLRYLFLGCIGNWHNSRELFSSGFSTLLCFEASPLGFCE